MIKKSWLTTVIGFLIGCLIYLTIESSTLIVFITGGVGYFLGLILDGADIKNQMETFHFTSITPTQQYFQVDDIPEALIMYSLKENVTSVMIDFKVEIKPQNFRLSVLKNLQDFEFRVIEDANKTIFSLSLEYPECNYPDLLATNQIDNMHFDIQEHSHDFQGALQKIVPGLVLSPIHYPDLFGDELDQSLQQSIIISPPKPSSPPSSGQNPDYNELRVDKSIENQDLIDFDEKTISQEMIDYSNKKLKYKTSDNLKTSLNSSSDDQNSSLSDKEDDIHDKSNINESEIMKDLFKPSQSMNKIQSESENSNLSSENVQELKDINARQFDEFLNETQSNDSSSLPNKPGLLSADKIANMAKTLPSYEDTKDVNYSELDQSEHSSEEIRHKENDSESLAGRSINTNLKLNNEKTDQQEFNDNKSVKIDYSSLDLSKMEIQDEKKPNEFDLDIIDRIESYMRQDITTSEIKQEIQNVRKALHQDHEPEKET